MSAVVDLFLGLGCSLRLVGDFVGCFGCSTVSRINVSICCPIDPLSIAVSRRACLLSVWIASLAPITSGLVRFMPGRQAESGQRCSRTPLFGAMALHARWPSDMGAKSSHCSRLFLPNPPLHHCTAWFTTLPSAFACALHHGQSWWPSRPRGIEALHPRALACCSIRSIRLLALGVPPWPRSPFGNLALAGFPFCPSLIFGDPGLG